MTCRSRCLIRDRVQPRRREHSSGQGRDPYPPLPDRSRSPTTQTVHIHGKGLQLRKPFTSAASVWSYTNRSPPRQGCGATQTVHIRGKGPELRKPFTSTVRVWSYANRSPPRQGSGATQTVHLRGKGLELRKPFTSTARPSQLRNLFTSATLGEPLWSTLLCLIEAKCNVPDSGRRFFVLRERRRAAACSSLIPCSYSYIQGHRTIIISVTYTFLHQQNGACK